MGNRRRIQCFSAQACVRFHDLKFLVVQPAWLEQNAIGDANLADIVQRACEIDKADEFGIDLPAKFFEARQMLCQHPRAR